MTLLDALKAVGSEDMSGRFPEHFLNEDFIPRPDDLELTEKAVGENARFCSLKEETVGKILEAVRAASADPAVSLLAKTVFRCIFTEPGAYAGPWAWQPLDKAMGPLAGPLYLAIAAGWVPLLRAYHGAVNVPEEVTRDTCYQLRAYCDNYFTGTGKCGIYPQQLSWMHCYLDRERLFVRLGRFEYRWMRYGLDGHVYRSRKNGELVIFAIPGMQFDSAGFAVENTPDSPERAFTSVYSEDAEAGTVTGSRVDAFGRTSPEPYTIRKADYDLILGRGMPILDMHIPNGGGMTPDEAERSFKRAKQFFNDLYEEERRPVAVVCASWIFNPNLPEFLNPESNLVRLLKRVHPVPRPSGKTDGLWFIFRHEGAFELLKAPRKTSLQRAVTDFIARGGRWRVGGMVLPMSEI